MNVRTRIAPSPTGFLHIGTARTALFNYLFAKHEKGEFLLRIEDTDLERSDRKYEEDIIEGLKWLGIDWDGEITRQSERLDIYEKYLTKLLETGTAFFCPHSEEELDAERKKQMANSESPKHVCEFRNEKSEIGGEKSRTGIIRFKNDAIEPIVFDDEIRGEISFDPKLFGDFSLAKNTRTPLYNFAVVVDDSEMEITHVIRGEDHISNTPKQILLQQALGIPDPKYAHLPLILGSDRSKLSKRHGATSVIEYREAGYLPEALFNFMALLGWNPGGDQEIYSKEELIKTFSLEKVQKAGAVFDIQKLDWMNSEYIRKKSAKELMELAMPFLEKEWLTPTPTPPPYLPADATHQALQAGEGGGERGRGLSSFLEKVIALEQPRLKKLSELPEKVDYFFKEPEYDKELLRWKQMSDEQIKESLNLSKILINEVPANNFNAKELGEKFCADKSIWPIDPRVTKVIFVKEDGRGGDFGPLLWPLRVALSGKKASPGPFEIMEILGQKTSILRVNSAIDKLK